MLRYQLRDAILRLTSGREHLDLEDFHEQDGRHTGIKYALAMSMYDVISRGIPEDDPDVILVKRAIRQLAQRDHIDWDKAESPEEIAREQPILDHLIKKDEPEKNRRLRFEARRAKGKTLILTEDQKKALLKPGQHKRVSIGADIALAQLGRIPYDRPFRFWDLKIGFQHTDMDVFVNRLIQLGILDVVETSECAQNALVQLGPRYVRYVEGTTTNFNPPHNWDVAKLYLDEKWKST